MEALLLEILSELRAASSVLERLDDERLEQIIHRHNRGRSVSDGLAHFAKKHLLPYYLDVRESDPQRWTSWQIDAALEQRLFATLRVKPRRTASGVATITVLTKPWPCAGDCLYCPSDPQMPKSYLSDEPACQRALLNHFDPYLQVASRLQALTQMGHMTDKIELIVLGGSWSDYPEDYQVWFICEMFKALNETDAERALRCQQRQEALTGAAGAAAVAGAAATAQQTTSIAELFAQHRLNEQANHRVVGLVVETRPDAITAQSLTLLRSFGCTKIQMGVQSLDAKILSLNNRHADLGTIQQAFALLRLYGFKIHVHFMLNLYGSTPEADICDYQRLVNEPAYLPDEVKLYPCVLVAGTTLEKLYRAGSWQPYSEAELIDVLVADTLATPPYTRISRMVRDISAKDILAGNKKANLRQLVEAEISQRGLSIQEIRFREIGTGGAQLDELKLEELSYATTVSEEFFLQWIDSQGRIAGFLRLSLPDAQALGVAFGDCEEGVIPIHGSEAMIREVHIYGQVAQLHQTDTGAQHLGLGRQLIEAACQLARQRGYQNINVISAIGTREYYRSLGFVNNGLYQQKHL
ncbi:MAG: tRNA uridine(34) 5-carboxymethylaminomethyl modification radical SAM/GNAT enzyme Elp3 [Coriobacteriales bacterium]|jgi:elongator complex protein 3|nr:tRNA uridine(34) 5-carboxymethylaminomethyl modification radical SAM/GNAT enzyme Elp3 [Coriobacteriales bacterium]